MAQTPKKLPSKRTTKAESTARQKALKKKHGGLHPEAVADYVPKHRLAIPTPNNKDAYGTLTDKSTYSEYAWAFLRRNRFYQRLIDKVLPEFDIGVWGYLSSANNAPSLGLVHLKHYIEPFASGTCVEWWGIHSFRDQLAFVRPQKQTKVDIEWPDSQVALIFDIDPLLGDHTTAIDQQIAMAKIHLHELAKAAKFSSSKGRRSPDKWILRAQLRVADLLSAPLTLMNASDLNPSERMAQDSAVRKLSADAGEPGDPTPTALHVGDIVARVPPYDLRKAACGRDARAQSANRSSMNELRKTESAKKVQSKEQKRSRVSKLSVDACDNIYKWGFLRWLQFDNWDHLANPVLPKTGPAHKGRSAKVTGGVGQKSKAPSSARTASKPGK